MKELLKYQEIDIELKKEEKKVSGSDCFKIVNKSKENAKKSQQKMIELNEEAKKLLEEINKIDTVKAKGVDLVNKYTNSKIDGLEEKAVIEIVNKIKPIKKNLEELMSRLNNMKFRMTKILEEFENAKKQIISSKKLYEEHKATLEKLKLEAEPLIEKVRTKLQEQEKRVKPELIQKYRNLKREGAFPVIYSLKDGKNCGYCRVELSMHKLDSLKLNGFTDCEQCHRIIISD